MSVRIITDSASDLSATAGKPVMVLPMTITFGTEEYQDGVTLTHAEFYDKLVEGDTIPFTSQIPPVDFENAYRKITEAGDTAVVIVMSSKLSGTCSGAMLAAQEYPGRIFVVDSESVTVGERILVEYALRLVEEGLDAASIALELERKKKNICLLALVDTLEYLYKGGRISRTAAFAGTLLTIKPVISVEDGEVKIVGKARGSRKGNNMLTELIDKKGGVDFSMPIMLGYSGLSDALLQKYIQDSAHLWRDHMDNLPFGTIGGTIGTHAGPGAIAIAFFHK